MIIVINMILNKKTASDIISFLIVGLWAYGGFTKNPWLSSVVGPLLFGSFIIITNRKQVDDNNAYYFRMSKKVPSLFPSSWVGKTSYKFQKLIAILVGIAFISVGIVSLIVVLFFEIS